MSQSVDHDYDEDNLEPIEDEESLPQITRQSSNGQLVDTSNQADSPGKGTT